MILSYGSAKRTLIMVAVYLICASLIIKGLSHLLEFNLMTNVQSYFSDEKINFQLPKLNLDSLSFDLISNTIREKIDGFLDIIFGSALGMINFVHFNGTKTALAGATKLVLKP